MLHFLPYVPSSPQCKASNTDASFLTYLMCHLTSSPIPTLILKNPSGLNTAFGTRQLPTGVWSAPADKPHVRDTLSFLTVEELGARIRGRTNQPKYFTKQDRPQIFWKKNFLAGAFIIEGCWLDIILMRFWCSWTGPWQSCGPQLG